MKFCAVVVAAVLIASCVALASDEGATKISVDSGLSGLLEESAEVISPGLLDSMIIDVEVTALGSIAQELIESIGITHNETVSKESLERLLEAAVTKVVENGTAAEEVVEEAEELVEETAVKSEVIPKGSNEGGIPIKVDKDACIDRYPFECPIYVERGECKENPGWMTVNCPAACGNCHLLDPKARCNRTTLGISEQPTYRPGDMNKMFESIVLKYGEMYDAQIHSRSPWVVTFEKFLTDKEVDAIISTNQKTWERSTDTGSMNEYGETGRILSKSRTSSNSWCRGECVTHPDVMSVVAKIVDITGIPSNNYESFQVLKYDIGQAYTAHHDFGGGPQGLQAAGPRVLTFFLYLSDVEEGGETAFPLLGIAVKPKKGKALLWPSVLDHDLQEFEPRTLHEARPVIKGTKFAANSWIHLYDYQIPNLWGCTGVFDYL